MSSAGIVSTKSQDNFLTRTLSEVDYSLFQINELRNLIFSYLVDGRIQYIVTLRKYKLRMNPNTQKRDLSELVSTFGAVLLSCSSGDPISGSLHLGRTEEFNPRTSSDDFARQFALLENADEFSNLTGKITLDKSVIHFDVDYRMNRLHDSVRASAIKKGEYTSIDREPLSVLEFGVFRQPEEDERINLDLLPKPEKVLQMSMQKSTQRARTSLFLGRSWSVLSKIPS